MFLNTYFLSSTIVLVSLFMFYILGSLITHFLKIKFNENLYYSTFLKLLSGLISSVFLVSVIFTKGNTVSIGIFIISLSYFLFNKKKIKVNPRQIKIKIHKTPLLIIILFSILLSLFYTLLYVNAPFNNILHFDEVFYSMLSSSISKSGIEYNNIFGANYNNRASSAYHYVELWLTIFFSKVFSINMNFSFSIITKVIINVILSTGMVALSKMFTKKKFFIFLAFLSITICPFLLDYSHIQQAAFNAHQPKLALCSCFYLLFIILIVNKSKNWFYSLLFLPIINIAFAPIILTFLSCIFIVNLLNKNTPKYNKELSISLIITTLFIGLFYYFQPKENFSEGISLKEYLPFYNINHFLEVVYKQSANYATYTIYFIPIIFLIANNTFKKNTTIKKIYKNYRILILYFIFSIPLGFVFSILFFPIAGYNAGQISSISNVFLINIVVYLSYLVTYKSVDNKYYKNLILIYLSICLIYTSTLFFISRKNFIVNPTDLKSETYLNNILNYITDENVLKGGIINSKYEIESHTKKNGSRSELLSSYWFIPLSTTIDYLELYNLSTLEETPKLFNNTKNISLKNYDDMINYFWEIQTKKIISQSPLVKFSKSIKSNNKEIIQYKFAEKENLKFIVMNKEAQLPKIFMSIIDTTFTDSLTKEKIYFLDFDKR